VSQSLTIQILTPADFALLNELRLKAAKDLVENTSSSSAKRKLAALESSKRHVGEDEADRFLAESDILGPRKKVKADYEERMESIRKGREGREKFGSRKGEKKAVGASSTNAQKKRNKPIMMALQYVLADGFLTGSPLTNQLEQRHAKEEAVSSRQANQASSFHREAKEDEALGVGVGFGFVVRCMYWFSPHHRPSSVEKIARAP
jgi:hypothetical protein